MEDKIREKESSKPKTDDENPTKPKQGGPDNSAEDGDDPEAYDKNGNLNEPDTGASANWKVKILKGKAKG